MTSRTAMWFGFAVLAGACAEEGLPPGASTPAADGGADVIVTADVFVAPDPGPQDTGMFEEVDTVGAEIEQPEDSVGPGDAVEPEDTGAPDDTAEPAEVAEPDTSQPEDTVQPEDTPTPEDVAADAGEPDVGEPDTHVPAAPCVLHQDCLDDDFCTADLCEDGQCVSTPASCDDGDPCWGNTCDSLVGCIDTFSGEAGCGAETALFEAHFDDGTLEGFEVLDLAQNLGSEEPVVWHADPSLTFTGAGAMYFGRLGHYDYDSGKVVAARATSPEIVLPAAQELTGSMWVWLDVEAGEDWDVLVLAVLTESGSTIPVWAKGQDNVPVATWTRVQVDLTAFGGQTVRLGVTFNSVDPTFNDTRGAVVDAMRVTTRVTPKGCQGNVDCDDGIACTVDTCVEGACTYEVGTECCVVAADCFDGDACTLDFCSGEGACLHVPVANPACCNTDAECEDNNPCTADVCEANNLCSNAVLLENSLVCCTNKAHCNDGDSCTIDTCIDFQCGYVNTCCQSDEECNDGDDVCTTDSCVAGACVYAYLPVPGCCEPVVFEEGFEAGSVDDWTLGTGSGSCKWQAFDGGQKKDGSWALYYGDVGAKNYDCGENGAFATSPEIDIPDKDGLSLEFDVWFEVELGESYDAITVRILQGNASTVAFAKPQMGAQSTWNHMVLSLDPYKGQTIRIEIQFSTEDTLYNDTEGVYFDNFKVTDPCE